MSRWTLEIQCSNCGAREEVPNDLDEIVPMVKPDWDNCGKLVCDALNGIAYDDDKCIVDGCVRKYYSEDPRTEITIQEAQ